MAELKEVLRGKRAVKSGKLVVKLVKQQVAELKEVLRARGLSSAGKKAELVLRLRGASSAA